MAKWIALQSKFNQYLYIRTDMVIMQTRCRLGDVLLKSVVTKVQKCVRGEGVLKNRKKFADVLCGWFLDPKKHRDFFSDLQIIVNELIILLSTYSGPLLHNDSWFVLFTFAC